MPEKWSKIEKFEKFIEKIHKFYLPYGFCSHLHNSFRFCLKLEILVLNGLNFIWHSTLRNPAKLDTVISVNIVSTCQK